MPSRQDLTVAETYPGFLSVLSQDTELQSRIARGEKPVLSYFYGSFQTGSEPLVTDSCYLLLTRFGVNLDLERTSTGKSKRWSWVTYLQEQKLHIEQLVQRRNKFVATNYQRNRIENQPPENRSTIESYFLVMELLACVQYQSAGGIFGRGNWNQMLAPEERLACVKKLIEFRLRYRELRLQQLREPRAGHEEQAEVESSLWLPKYGNDVFLEITGLRGKEG